MTLRARMVITRPCAWSKDIGAHAGERFIDRQTVQAVVGGGQEVHRRVVRQQGHVGPCLQRLDQPLLDGPAGGVAHVQDAAGRVGRFADVLELAIGRAGKGHPQAVDQELLEQGRALARQQAHGLRIVVAVAGAHQVGGQQIGRVVGAAVDDAPWA
jgi:hypothetical protein